MPVAPDRGGLRERAGEDARRVATALGRDPAPYDVAAARLRLDHVTSAFARGVARATVLEASALLGAELRSVDGVEAWVSRDGSAALVTPDCDLVGIWTIAAPDRAEPLLRAVLGHYSLEAVPAAYAAVTPDTERLFTRLGFA